MKRWALVVLVVLGGCPSTVPLGGEAGRAPPVVSDPSVSVEPMPSETVNSVEEFQNSTWLVFAISEISSVTATAFAISETRLATNAHVVQGILAVLQEPGGRASVFQHETGMARELVRVWTHPEYDARAPEPTPDVGVISTGTLIPVFVTIPGLDSLPPIDVLEQVTLCGFPGSVTFGIDFLGGLISGEFHPRASCLTGNVSALRPFQGGQSLTQSNGRLIQYDVSTEGGLSGSAVFNEQGVVIGVHALGFSSDAEQNFAMRVDVLAELVSLIDQGTIRGINLSDVQDLAPPVLPEPQPPAGVTCGSGCEFCWFGTANEGECPSRWNGDGECDCGCQFSDVDCTNGLLLGVLAPLAVLGVPTGFGCGSVCVQFPGPNGLFCDSDCDKWFDDVEIDFGSDPCDPLSPPFPPDSGGATVCVDVFGPAKARLRTLKEFRDTRTAQFGLMEGHLGMAPP